MKVDLGQCAVCGAKNSKYVENCYKCGAPLPWAPGYIAPKEAPQSQSVKPQSGAPDNAKTVAVTPRDATPNPVVAPQVQMEPNAKQRAQSKVAVPAWALGVGGLGLVALGMGLWALLGPKPLATAPTIVAPTTAATAPATAPALAPIVPVASATSSATPNVTPIATPLAQPSGAPTTAATGTTNAAVASATTAPAAQTQAPIIPAVAPATGPTFDELYTNLTTGTPQQQTLYWNSVKGKRISWRGEFVNLGNATTGPLTLTVNCKSAKGALKVAVELGTATPQTLPQLNQPVPFSGVLQSRETGAITVNQGRVNG